MLSEAYVDPNFYRVSCDAQDGDEKHWREVISSVGVIYRGNHDKRSATVPNCVKLVNTVSPIGVDILALIRRHKFTTHEQTGLRVTY
jgi:hypothetical protein